MEWAFLIFLLNASGIDIVSTIPPLMATWSGLHHANHSTVNVVNIYFTTNARDIYGPDYVIWFLEKIQPTKL